jgi:hypothetical protein
VVTPNTPSNRRFMGNSIFKSLKKGSFWQRKSLFQRVKKQNLLSLLLQT